MRSPTLSWADLTRPRNTDLRHHFCLLLLDNGLGSDLGTWMLGQELQPGPSKPLRRRTFRPVAHRRRREMETTLGSEHIGQLFFDETPDVVVNASCIRCATGLGNGGLRPDLPAVLPACTGEHQEGVTELMSQRPRFRVQDPGLIRLGSRRTGKVTVDAQR